MVAAGRTLAAFVGAALIASGAWAQPKALSFKAGDAEKWTFSMAGKPIGTSTATCTAARQVGGKRLSDWRFGIKLNLSQQGQQVQLAIDGTFTITDKGNPTALAITATVNGQQQKLSGTFAGSKAKLTAQAGGQSQSREAAITGKEYLSINNVMTLFSIATRALGIQPGKTVKAPFFAVELMRSLDITFAARPRTETISFGGGKVECVVCDVSPIQARIHVSKATGEMLRYAVDAQKLVIERK
jgi:hypothetical protein